MSYYHTSSVGGLWYEGFFAEIEARFLLERDKD